MRQRDENLVIPPNDLGWLSDASDEPVRVGPADETREHGIYSTPDGGFAVTQMWSREEADDEARRLVAAGEFDAGDLEILEICPDHAEQPRETCEECATDDDSETEDER